MEKKTKLKIIFGLILLLIIGWPTIILGPFSWNLEEKFGSGAEGQVETIIQIDPPSFEVGKIKIKDFKPQRRIYFLNETAYVNFTIENGLAIPYNFTVHWINEGKIICEWFNKSDIVGYIRQKPWAWCPVGNAGDWEVLLLLYYEKSDIPIEEITSFKVVEK